MKEDTTQDVMRAGKNASTGLKSMQVALQDTAAIIARMQNSDFAGRILEFAKEKDLNGLSELLNSAASKSQVKVKSVEDFKIEAIILTDGKQYYVCIGDGCHHHSGKKSPIVFEESQFQCLKRLPR
jgi:hypothetical protein